MAKNSNQPVDDLVTLSDEIIGSLSCFVTWSKDRNTSETSYEGDFEKDDGKGDRDNSDGKGGAKTEAVPPSVHWMPPYIPKKKWQALGDLVTANEKATGQRSSIGGEEWFTLRLDGSNFSSSVKKLRHCGLIEKQGFSEKFSKCMQKVCLKLMEKFDAKLGFTQSDEMVIFVAPASVIRGEQQAHSRGGRVTKTTTLAAGYATSVFVTELLLMAAKEESKLNRTEEIEPLEKTNASEKKAIESLEEDEGKQSEEVKTAGSKQLHDVKITEGKQLAEVKTAESRQPRELKTVKGKQSGGVEITDQEGGKTTNIEDFDHVREEGIPLAEQPARNKTNQQINKFHEFTEATQQIGPHFDCRIGAWKNWEEARSLLLWRAEDCCVNGVSDAVYQHQNPRGKKEIMKKDRRAKISWLYEHGRLPLHPHQAYGSVFCKVKRVRVGFNPNTQETVPCLRGVIEMRSVPVLELFGRVDEEGLFLKDEVL